MFQPPRLTQPDAGEIHAVATVTHTLLGKTARVGVSDGRQFEGVFVCVDSDMNIILEKAHEYRSQNTPEDGAAIATSLAPVEQKRWAGMVMLPGKHVVHVAVNAVPPPARPPYPAAFALPAPPPPAAGGGQSLEKARTDDIRNAFPQDVSLYS